MRKIQHIFDSTLDTKLISELTFDNDTLVYNELTDEMFRFVKPIDTSVAFGTWKANLPKYTYQYIGGVMTPTTSFGDLAASYSLFDTTAVFVSDLSDVFTNDGSLAYVG
jgi:hypothetical protein